MIGAGLSYFGSILPCLNDLIQQIDDIIWGFYWNGKPDKIKRDVIRGKTDREGTGRINIRFKLDSLKLKWLSTFNTGVGKWRSLFNYWINRASDKYNLGWYVFNNPLIGVQTTVFYKDLLRSFRRAEERINTFVTCYNEAQDLPLLKNTIITNNKHKDIDSKILPVIGCTRLHHVFYNFKLKTCQQFSEECNLCPMNAGRIRKRL